MEITELLELRRQNLLTDEELAYAIKKLKATEENKKGELTKEDEETAERINNDSIDAINLANRNRERAENMRKEWAHRASEQRLSRQQDEELLLAKTVLASLTNRMGSRVYSDEIINNMEYYEAMSLYDGILENMTVENRNELVNKAKKDIKEGRGFNFQPVAPTIPVEPVVPEPEEPVIDESQPTIDGEPEIEPLPEEPTVSDENEPEITPIPVEPVSQPEPAEPIEPEPLPGFDDSEPEPIEPLPEEVNEEEEPEIVPVPVVPGVTPQPDPVEPEQEDEEENEEENEEEQTVAPIPVEVVQPKPSLWKKVVIITGAAITFLNGIAIAVHTGLMAKNTNALKKDTDEIIGLVKEQDQDLDKADEEKEEKDDNKDNTLEDNTSLSDNTGGNGGGQTSNPDNKPSTPSKPSNPGNDSPSNPGTTDQGKDDSKEDDSKKDDSGKDDSGKDDSEKDDSETKDKDVFPIHLDPSQNESAMDTSTGIEVTADGTTYKHNEDGTYSKVGDQDLKYDENGNALVEKDNLQDNTEEKVEVPKTGEEKPLDEATKDMSEEEQNNLIDAIEDFDWNNFFDSQPQQSGPSR